MYIQYFLDERFAEKHSETAEEACGLET